MPTPILETIDQLVDSLADHSFHVVEIPGRDYHFVMKRDDNQAPYRAYAPPALVSEAVDLGVLVESMDCCSAYELASKSA